VFKLKSRHDNKNTKDTNKKSYRIKIKTEQEFIY